MKRAGALSAGLPALFLCSGRDPSPRHTAFCAHVSEGPVSLVTATPPQALSPRHYTFLHVGCEYWGCGMLPRSLAMQPAQPWEGSHRQMEVVRPPIGQREGTLPLVTPRMLPFQSKMRRNSRLNPTERGRETVLLLVAPANSAASASAPDGSQGRNGAPAA